MASLTYFSNKSIKVVEYSVEIQNLPSKFEAFTILHMTDLHSKHFGENQKEILALVETLEYQMVAFTGDLDNKYGPDMEPGIQLLAGLLDKPIYFVPGNHDWSTGYRFREQLLAMGINILENRSQKFALGTDHLWILGVDDPYSRRARLDRSLDSVQDDNPRILLAHAPEIYHQAVDENIDLVLAGHTHGGQIRLPFVGSLVAPGQGLLPRLDYGHYAEKNTQMIISGGLGESVVPLRFGIRPEVVLVKLTTGGR